MTEEKELAQGFTPKHIMLGVSGMVIFAIAVWILSTPTLHGWWVLWVSIVTVVGLFLFLVFLFTPLYLLFLKVIDKLMGPKWAEAQKAKRQEWGDHKRKKLGLCEKCGCDLRASKDRCPECGACFEKPKRSADC